MSLPKTLNPSDWEKYVHTGDRIFIGSGAACPTTLVKSLVANAKRFYDVEVCHILTLGDNPWTREEFKEHFRTNALFLGPGSRDAVQAGFGDYTPTFLSEVPHLFSRRILPLDVALVQVTPPDAMGYCSLGVSVDVVMSGVKNAAVVIAQVNRQMPRTLGQSFIHVSEIDAWIEVDEPLPELAPPVLDDVTLRIGKYVSMLVSDGDNLQMGIGKIPDATLRYLGDRNDLGIHTEMFSDGLIDLMKKGVVNNKRKEFHTDRTVTSFVMGTRALYDFVHENPHVNFFPSDYVNNPVNIARNPNQIAINSAIEVDLSGQVVADSVGFRFFSGIGGQVDFIRGASMSRGGKPIIALPSTAKKGTLSRIVPVLTEGSGVVTSRGDVFYVVTEFGIASLRGRSIRERALELIQVAHPDFRDQLLHEVRKHFWVPNFVHRQPTRVVEMGEVEMRKLTLKDGEDYVLRPLRPSDIGRLQRFFYSHSPETILQRYRTQQARMSQERAYGLVNVDQTRDLALCIVLQQGPREQIPAVGRYYYIEQEEAGEVAFVVRESRRGIGMAKALIHELIRIAMARKLKKLVAFTRVDNGPMLHGLDLFGFKRVGVEEGEVHLELDLTTLTEMPGPK
ncbi:MAG: GNAT family N-acetyltransferase [Magnetococcus sp. WYHC-3]